MANKAVAASNRLRDERGRLLFYAKRSQRYHDHRRGFFKAIIQWFQFFNLIFGSAGVVTYLGETGRTDVLALASAFAAISAAILISVKAVDMEELHAKLLDRCIVFEQRLYKVRNPTEADIADFRYERLELEKMEPRVYHAVQRMCRNEVIRAEGTDGKIRDLGWLQNIFKDVWRYKSILKEIHTV